MNILEKQIRQVLSQVASIESASVSVGSVYITISEVNRVYPLAFEFRKSNDREFPFVFINQNFEQARANLLEADIKLSDIEYMRACLKLIAFHKCSRLNFHYTKALKV